MLHVVEILKEGSNKILMNLVNMFYLFENSNPEIKEKLYFVRDFYLKKCIKINFKFTNFKKF